MKMEWWGGAGSWGGGHQKGWEVVIKRELLGRWSSRADGRWWVMVVIKRELMGSWWSSKGS